MMPEDLRIDTYRTTQSVNNSSAGIRITHIPTGIYIEYIRTYGMYISDGVELLKEKIWNTQLDEILSG